MKIQLLLETNQGPVSLEVPMAPDQVLRTLTVSADGDAIIKVPFYIHEGGSVHTICSRLNDDVREMEW